MRRETDSRIIINKVIRRKLLYFFFSHWAVKKLVDIKCAQSGNKKKKKKQCHGTYRIFSSIPTGQS